MWRNFIGLEVVATDIAGLVFAILIPKKDLYPAIISFT